MKLPVEKVLPGYTNSAKFGELGFPPSIFGRVSLMASNNFRRAVRYATLLHFSKYSPSVIRSLPNIDELINQSNEPSFASSVAGLFPTNQKSVVERYTKFLQAFTSFAEDYYALYLKDQIYPEMLRKTDKPPLFLFCQGSPEFFNRIGISVVGTRNPSELGAKRAQKLAMLLSVKGYVVVSGLAKGIDTAAHIGAIKAGGKTIAVIGTPLNQCYPKENCNLQKVIAKDHLLVTQYPFAHPVTRANFPTRNYTMSGISYATVVIEAGETSGALIQARQCMTQGRHLFILKNLLDRQDLKWPKKYVEKGAFVIEDIEDIPTALQKLPDYKIDSREHEDAHLL
jgi:DNA processing protein